MHFPVHDGGLKKAPLEWVALSTEFSTAVEAHSELGRRAFYKVNPTPPSLQLIIFPSSQKSCLIMTNFTSFISR